MNLSNLRNQLERKKGQSQQIESSIADTEKRIGIAEKELKFSQQAHLIIQTVAKQTQQELEYRIAEPVILALAAVFPDPYSFGVEFIEKRNKTEADLHFLKDDIKYDPLTSAGGGPVDVASFALRMALWSLKRPRTRNVIVLDEPFRFLSRDLQPKAGLMLKEVSDKLGLQIIMITHNSDLIEAGDKVFETSIEKGITTVKEV